MQKFIMIFLSLLTLTVHAGERVILSDEIKVVAEINSDTVFCSEIGYGAKELKINIKDLDGKTILDHSNFRFGDPSRLPCMTAGFCKGSFGDEGLTVEDVLQDKPGQEKVVVKRQVIETLYKAFDNVNQEYFCQREITEKLTTVIRGVSFHHQRNLSAEKFPLEKCSDE